MSELASESMSQGDRERRHRACEGAFVRGKGAGYVVVQAILLIAALVAPVLGRLSWPTAVAVVGGLLAAAGLAIVTVASLTLGRRSLSPLPKPKEGAVFVQHGIFAAVRHPIYSGLTLFVLGWGLAWSSLSVVVATPVLLVFFDIKARLEERWLTAEFAGYTDYRRRVRKLIPLVY